MVPVRPQINFVIPDSIYRDDGSVTMARCTETHKDRSGKGYRRLDDYSGPQGNLLESLFGKHFLYCMLVRYLKITLPISGDNSVRLIVDGRALPSVLYCFQYSCGNLDT